MVRTRASFGDFLRGSLASLRSGTIANPFATTQYVNAARDQRLAAQLGRSAVRGMTDNAVDAWLEAINKQPGRRKVQYSSTDGKVRVKSGWSRDYRQATTDIIVGDADDRENHLHVIILDDGRVIHQAWTHNHE